MNNELQTSQNVNQLIIQLHEALKISTKALETSEIVVSELRKENQELKPKAEFYDSVVDSSSWFDVESVFKMINIKGIGRNNGYKFLCDTKFFFKSQHGNNGKTLYKPYADIENAGYSKLVQTKFLKDGEIKIHLKPVISQRGINYILKLINGATNEQKYNAI